MNFIDTHQHLILRDHFDYAWAAGLSPLAEGSFTLEDYASLTEGHGVVGTVFMEAAVADHQYRDEARLVADFMGKGTMLGQIASCRPEEADGISDWLEECRDLGVVGFRRILHVVPDDLSTTQTFRDNIRKIGAAGYVFDMCFLARQLPLAEQLARSCDDQVLVLDHCGVPDIAGGAFENWAAGISLLARLPHVRVKLSGITAYCAPGVHDEATLAPWVSHVLDVFGPDRMVWGGDWPVVDTGAGLPGWIDLTRSLLAGLSEDEQKKITEDNARAVYGLRRPGRWEAGN